MPRPVHELSDQCGGVTDEGVDWKCQECVHGYDHESCTLSLHMLVDMEKDSHPRAARVHMFPCSRVIENAEGETLRAEKMPSKGERVRGTLSGFAVWRWSAQLRCHRQV
jgi:hypothetical protein